jgi:hypothetical protein
MSRRELLGLGGLSALGLGLPQLFAGRSALASAGAAARPARAKSVILLFMLGGPAHQDTWDLKPDAPAEVRGTFQPARTRVPGVFISEHLPHLARRMDKLALVRSVTHADNNHSTGGYTMMTGRPSPRPLEGALPSASDYPHIGAIAAKYLPARNSLPPYVILPDRAYNDGGITWPGQGGGFLGKKYDPFIIASNLTKPAFSVDALDLPAGMTADRFDRRRRLLDEMGKNWRPGSGPAGDARIGAAYERALALLGSPEVRKAFDLGQESAKVRQSYLMNNFGQGCLMARRLVEAGVPLITVNWNRAVGSAPQSPHWDTHGNNFNQLKDVLLPSVDGAIATLLDDLSARGLLEETLVVWMSEFGRTPKINGNAGRDHYGRCNSIWFAGAGVRGGQVIGSSDRTASAPHDSPIAPADVTATILEALGLDPLSEMHDMFNRPLPLSEGRVMRELYS